MIVYEVCSTEWTHKLFRTLREAKAFISENEITDYYIQKSKMTKPTVEAMIDIINSQGGSWCEESYGVIASGGMWKEENALPRGF